MRILMLTDFYHPVTGGLERYAQLLSEGLQQAGHQVEVATLRPPGTARTEPVGGVLVHRLEGWGRLLRKCYSDPQRPYHPPVADPGIARQLHRVMDEFRPDVVNAHSWILFSALSATGAGGPPLLVTLHDYGLACPRRDYLHQGTVCSGPGMRKCPTCASEVYGLPAAAAVTAALRVGWHGLRKVSRYIANSRATAAANGAVLDGLAPVEVIPPLIPNDILIRAEAAGRPGFLPEADGYLLFVGVPEPYKGLNVLLAAQTRLRHQVPLVVIGTRPAGPGRAAVTRDGRPVVTATGVPYEQVLAAFRHCAVAAVPSVWQEPFGMVAAEAAACGAPVVASDTGGLSDVVVPGRTGLLVPPGDPAALAEALDNLLGDPAARHRMGAAAAARAEEFRACHIVPRVVRAYRAALRSGTPTASVPESALFSRRSPASRRPRTSAEGQHELRTGRLP